MKKNLLLTLGLCSAVLLTGCKSKESAFRQAYEKAKAQEVENEQQAATTTQETATQTVAVTPVTTTETPVTAADNSDVRTINGDISVTRGNALKTYSVVVGSFVTEANANALMGRLQSEGYDSRVVKTNETIKGKTGWYRVIASSYDDKTSAVQSRGALKAKYPDAWVLYRK